MPGAQVDDEQVEQTLSFQASGAGHLCNDAAFFGLHAQALIVAVLADGQGGFGSELENDGEEVADVFNAEIFNIAPRQGARPGRTKAERQASRSSPGGGSAARTSKS